MVFVTCLLGACGDKAVTPLAPPTPAPRYTGPTFLHGTIGSMTTVRGYFPLFVTGFSLVANLDNTGSADCPPALRQWLINEAVRQGFGEVGTPYEHLRPANFIASDTTAVVTVSGIIPAGAAAGTRFDLVVEALRQTQTTSLAGGVLYTTELSPRGLDLSHAPLNPPGEGRGPIFLNPFALASPEGMDIDATDDPRIGRVLGGGQLRRDRPLQLGLNHASHTLAARIADRLNGPGLLQQMPEDDRPFAEARTSDLIELNILTRYRGDTTHMLEVARHVFLNPTQQYARAKARELLTVLEQPSQQRHAERIAYAWEAMGKQNLTFLRTLYDHPDPVVRMTALTAATDLGDARVLPSLEAVATQQSAGSQDQATRLLGRLMRHDGANFRAASVLRKLVNSEDQMVRLAAFEKLDRYGSKVIERRIVSHKLLEIDVIASDRPMVYVTRQGRPRIVIFGRNLEIETPLFFSTWGDRLMMRAKEPNGLVEVYCRPTTASEAIEAQSLPTVVEIVSLMAARPGEDGALRGFDLDYARIVSTLEQLTREGWIDAPFVMESSDLMQRVAEHQLNEAREPGRPESDVRERQDLAEPGDSGDNPANQ